MTSGVIAIEPENSVADTDQLLGEPELVQQGADGSQRRFVARARDGPRRFLTVALPVERRIRRTQALGDPGDFFLRRGGVDDGELRG
jgi:hypothetical protein